jgi:hypothetical protein
MREWTDGAAVLRLAAVHQSIAQIIDRWHGGSSTVPGRI